MVEHPGEYPWSSYRANGMGLKIGLISPHQEYLSLGDTSASRILVYRSMVEKGVSHQDMDDIRICANKEWVIGSDKFKQQIAAANDRRVTRSQWGGDRKSKRFEESFVK